MVELPRDERGRGGIGCVESMAAVHRPAIAVRGDGRMRVETPDVSRSPSVIARRMPGMSSKRSPKRPSTSRGTARCLPRKARSCSGEGVAIPASESTVGAGSTNATGSTTNGCLSRIDYLDGLGHLGIGAHPGWQAAGGLEVAHFQPLGETEGKRAVRT